MKKRYIILTGSIIFIVLLIILFINFFPYIIVNNEENSKLLENYNMKLSQFENEMNEIAIGNNESSFNKWTSLKNRYYDSTSLQLYDLLIQYLNNCYMYAIDDGTNISYSNYISKFTDLKRINKNDFENLIVGYEINNEGCLRNFNSMKIIVINNNNLLELVDEFDIYYSSVKNKKFQNYKEILQNENKKIDLMLKATYFLKNDL